MSELFGQFHQQMRAAFSSKTWATMCKIYTLKELYYPGMNLTLNNSIDINGNISIDYNPVIILQRSPRTDLRIEISDDRVYFSENGYNKFDFAITHGALNKLIEMLKSIKLTEIIET